MSKFQDESVQALSRAMQTVTADAADAVVAITVDKSGNMSFSVTHKEGISMMLMIGAVETVKSQMMAMLSTTQQATVTREDQPDGAAKEIADTVTGG